MFTRRNFTLMLLLITALSLSAAAQTQISFGASSSGQTVSFSASGAQQPIAMSFSGSCTVQGTNQSNCMSGPGMFQNGSSSVAGNYYMWMTGGGPTLTQTSIGQYAANMNGSNFNFFWSDAAGTVGGTIALTGASQLPNHPQVFFAGTLTINTSTGSYSSLFPTNGSGSFDVTFYLTSAKVSLDSLWANGGEARGYLSSGELVPPVPEPASMALLGSGLLAMGGMLRFRKKQ